MPNDAATKPDLSLTVLAKLLTPEQRAAMKQTIPRVLPSWKRVIRVEVESGRVVLSPADNDQQFRGSPLTFNEIVEDLLSREGFTVFSFGFIDDRCLDVADWLDGEPAWAVALGGTELKEVEIDRETMSEYEREAIDNLRSWRSQNWYRSIALLLLESGVCVGGWVDTKTGQYEINITLIFKSQLDAEIFALRYAQHAIWSFGESDEIDVGGDGSTEWESQQ